MVVNVMGANRDHNAQVAPVSSPTWTGVWTADTSRPTLGHQRDCTSRYPVRNRRRGGKEGREGKREVEEGRGGKRKKESE